MSSMTSGYAAMNLWSCFHSVPTEKSVEDSGCLWYDSVSLGEWFSVFQRNVVPPSSGTKRQFFWNLFTFEEKTLHSFDMSDSTRPVTRQHVSEAPNPHQHSRENVRSHASAHCAFVYTTH